VKNSYETLGLSWSLQGRFLSVFKYRKIEKKRKWKDSLVELHGFGYSKSALPAEDRGAEY